MQDPASETPSPRFRRMSLALLAGLAVLTLASQAIAGEEPALPDLSDSELAEVHNGEVHVELDKSSSINRGIVIGIIQDDINDVTPLIARCWEYGDWRDNLRDTGLEERRSDNNVVCSGTARVPFPGRNRHGHFDVHNQTTDVEGTRAYVSTFEYIDDSGNMEDMFGYWVAYPYGPDNEHTMLKHVLNVDIGGWLPDFLIRWATRRTLPNTVLGIRNQLDSSRSEPLFWNDYDYE